MSDSYSDQQQPGPDTPSTQEYSGAGPAGSRPPYYPPPQNLPTKSRIAAGVLSGVVPGLGQVYVGFYQLGFIYVGIFAATIAALANMDSHGDVGLAPLFGIFLGFFYFYNIIDAVRRASLYNEAVLRSQHGGMPESFKLPTGQGSMFGGVSLIIIGLLFFLNTKFDVSMDWLEEYWPLGAIAIGVYLVLQSKKNRES